MSVQALVWVIEDAPNVPSHLGLLLMGLANHADDQGCGAYPSIGRLAHYTRKHERNTQRDIVKLLDLGLIREGDQRLVAHFDPRYRPIVYDLAMERKRDPYISPARTVPIKPVDNSRRRGGADATPTPSRGGVQDIQGWRTGHPGVAPTPPKPSFEPSLESKENPPTPRDRLSETSAPAGAEPGGGFSQDGQDWTERDRKGAEVLGDLLTAFQSEQPRAERVAPQGYDDGGGYDDDRLDDSLMGSSPEDVAATVVGSLDELVPAMPELSFGDRARVRTAMVATLRRGVSLDVMLRELERRTPADVQGWGRFLVARLEKIGMPRSDGRPPWCGKCEEATRWILKTVMVGDWEEQRPACCPRCHPRSASVDV